MLIKTVPLVLGLLVVVVAAAGDDGPDFSFGDVDFSVKYFKAAFNASSNCVVSPLSVRLALAAFYQVAGADVEETLQRAFYLPLEKSIASDNAAGFLEEIASSQQLQVAFKTLKNQDPLSDEFASTLKKVFKTTAEIVKFENKPSVVSSVNQWASEATNGRIQNFLNDKDLDTTTELIFLNAVALKAEWAAKFSTSKTDRQTFAFLNGPRQVDMMHETMEVLYKIDHTYHAIQIPYSEDSDLSMWILVPRGKSGSFEGLMSSLSSNLLDNIETTAMPKIVDISLPRFQIKTDQEAKHIIERMGYGELFTKNDFNVFKGRKSRLSDLRQSTFLKVDEEGTEAAVVSSIMTKFRVGNAQFNVNQPFVFIVKKISTDTTVFIGHYSNHDLISSKNFLTNIDCCPVSDEELHHQQEEFPTPKSTSKSKSVSWMEQSPSGHVNVTENMKHMNANR